MMDALPAPRTRLDRARALLRGHGAVLALLMVYVIGLRAIMFELNMLAMPAAERDGVLRQVVLFFRYFVEPGEIADLLLQVGLCAGIYALLDRLRERRLAIRLALAFALTLVAAMAMAAALWVQIGVTGMPLKQPREVAVARNFLFSLAPLGLWAVTAMAFTHSRVLQERDRAMAELRFAAQDARLRALRYQLNPHFLFNSLNSLSAMLWDRDWRGAEAMTVAFSEFLREVLASEPEQDVPLVRELEVQRKYLAIEQARFGARLEVVFLTQPGLGDQPVPNLILQPLVENAIRHAVARTAEPVRLTVAARREGRALVLSVEDATAGAKSAPRPGTGLGLGNVRQRLAAQFGGAAALLIEPRPGGMRATVRLPLEQG